MPTILGLGGGRYFCAKYPAKSTASIDVPVKKREQLGWVKLPINDCIYFSFRKKYTIYYCKKYI